MASRYVLKHRRALAVSSLFLLGCDSTDPFSSGQGHASVLISVADSAGQPLPGASVRIACGNGGPSAVLQTDSSGHVGANLNSRTESFSGQGIRLPCQIAEPAQGLTRAAMDTVIGFSRGPVLVPLQSFDLREH